MAMSVLAGDMVKREQVKNMLLKRFDSSQSERIEDFLQLMFYINKQITFDEFSQNAFEFLFQLSESSQEEHLMQYDNNSAGDCGWPH